ncbi:MAG: OadG family protein [Clostridiales bacterium]|nr:OadG family protein [Clostridiales bacterium]
MSVFLAVEFAYDTIGEKFSLCGRMILTGLGTVFLVLCILWGVISIFGAVAMLRAKKERERIMEQVKNSPAPNDAKRSVPETAPVSTDETEEDDGALIAVITAAIEAFRAAEGAAPGSYRVVSFKRKNTRKSWNGPIDD